MMFSNYFITAYRFLKHHIFFSAINLIGLAIALTACLLMGLYIQFELSYDSFNSKSNQIYRLVTDIKTPNSISYQSSAGPMAPTIESTFPEVMASVRIFPDYFLVQNEEKKDIFSEVHIAYVDSNIFSIFDFELIKGNPEKAFNDPFNIVISESSSIKYFGTTEAVGKTLLLDSKHPALVTGVMKDIPANSHFQTDMFISMSTLLDVYSPMWGKRWDIFGFYTYLVLPDGYNPTDLERKFPEWISQYIVKDHVEYQLSLESLSDVYFHGRARAHRTGGSIHGNLTSVRAFALIALLVLIIASFNFVNLTTALSLHRSKEIGIRKVLGALRSQLVGQFLTDAVLLSLIASAIALLLTIFLLPQFNELAGKVIADNIFSSPRLLLAWFALALGIGILSGTYPALVLSGFKPIQALKGKMKTGKEGKWLRKTLVTAQFSISIILIVLTTVVYKQVNFLQNQDLGFRKKHMIAIDYHYDYRITDNPLAIKETLHKISGVENVSLSSAIPGGLNQKRPTQIENSYKEMQELESDTYYVDWNFISQYDINIVAGRDFSEFHTSDIDNGMIINESAARSIGYQNASEAVGKTFKQVGRSGTIIGVVSDFRFHSLRESTRPLTLMVSSGFFTFITVSLFSENTQGTINQIQNKWNELYPDLPMSYSFNDDTYDRIYKSEARSGKLFTVFAILAIAISCLGLLGLTTFNVTNRTKEIGIRKVLGSSEFGIVSLLSKEFLSLIVIAFALATPLAWVISRQWLDGFASRISPSLWIYLGAGSAVILLGMITIGFQTLRAARINPSETLMTE